MSPQYALESFSFKAISKEMVELDAKLAKLRIDIINKLRRMTSFQREKMIKLEKLVKKKKGRRGKE